MPIIKRYLENHLREDLTEKMVFLGGPRQVGKTTLALQFLSPPLKTNKSYFNWDVSEQRELLRKDKLPGDDGIFVLDEIHKFKRWRGLVKGFYDLYYPNKNFLVTGSARLDYYRKGGDSLQGRYHYWRLHPISLPEINSNKSIEHLLNFGGFPEPFQKGDTKFWRRWNRERLDRIVREDLRDLENVREISSIELLVDALPERVGSQLSLNSLAEDLEVAPRTIERWIDMLERLYVVFRISPFGAPKIRAIKKTKKLYFWDWASIANPGSRFENFVASHLLKYCHFLEDSEGHKMELRYLRDTDGREVDFVVLKDRKPLFAVECKTGEKNLSPAISYFAERTNIPKFYQVHLGKKDFGDATRNGRVLPFASFAREVGLV